MAGIIITSLPTTFQAALEADSCCLAQFICLRPSRSRGWLQSAHAGDHRVVAGLVVAVLALVEHDQVHRLAELQPAEDPVERLPA